MGIKIHNSLPPDLKRIENFKVFENKLKSYLLQNCFYSLQKFLVTTMDGDLVAQVGFDVMWMNIRRWYKCMCCFILDCWGLSSAVAKLQGWDNDPMLIVLFLILCIIL
jgi:hypothetical protein